MWLNRFTNYLLTHPLQTVVFAFAVTFVPILGIVGILVAALITLRKSVIEGAIVTVSATIPYVISFYIGRHQHDAGSLLMLWAAVGVAVSSNILTYVLAVMLRQQVSISNLLQLTALFGVLLISVVHLVFPDVADWWGRELHALSLQAAAITDGVTQSSATLGETQINAINLTKYYATGVIVMGVLFNAVIQLFIARMWLAALFFPTAAVRQLHHIRLSHLAGLLFVMSLVLSYMGNSVVQDMMPVLYALFCAAGLSVVHYTFNLMTSPTRWFWLMLIYVVILFSMPMSIMIVAMIALLDIGFDVRKRLSKI